MKTVFKKFLSGFLAVLMVVAIGVTQVNATEYAYSFGTEYEDIDTSQRAKDASMYFSLCGYTSYYNIKPYEAYMKGDNANGVRRISSEVVSHHGHANYNCQVYEWVGSSLPKYDTGIYYGNDMVSSSSGIDYVGVTDSDSDFSDTKFVEYIGCKTGYGSTNLVTRTKDEGAECVLGKKESVGTTSQTQWVNRFNNQLANGYSIDDAVDYANGFTYTDSAVKNNLIKGDGSLVIDKSSNKSASDVKSIITKNFGTESLATYEKYASESAERKTVDLPKTTQLHSTGDIFVDTTNQLALAINGFDINNYKQVVTDGTYKGDYIIDYLELVNGCESESGYTVIVKSNTIKTIYDNSIPIDSKLTSTLTTKPVMTNSMIDKAYTEAAAVYANNKNYEVTSQSGKLVYDLENGYTVYRVRTEYYLNNETFYVDIYDFILD